MPQTFYDVVWIFIIYAFIGWCTEVAYAALEKGVFVNRGFLNGPYCPIYGCGVLTVVVILTPLKGNLLILYLGSFFLTSILEFITGFVLERAFHNKWWDYTDKPFNIMGYVCLKFSILWGFACTFIMLILHPIIYKIIQIIPHIFGILLLIVIMTAFAVDMIVTISSIIKFNKNLKLMDEIASKLKFISNEIGENVYENVMEALEMKDEFIVTHEELLGEIGEKKEILTVGVDNIKTSVEYRKDRITGSVKNTVNETKDKFMEAAVGVKEKLVKEKEELTVKYNQLYEKKNPVVGRLMKAFPNMKSMDYNELLQKIKKRNLEK